MTDLIPRDAALAVLAHDRIRMNVSGTEFRVISTQDHIDAIRAIPTIDPAAIREAALREALKALDNLPEYGSPDVNIGVSNAYSAILALIGKANSMIGEKK